MARAIGKAIPCSFCGLPILGTNRAPDTEPVPGRYYCCSGCRLAEAILQEQAATGSTQRTLIQLGLAVFFSMNVMVFSMALWSRDVYSGSESPAADAWHELFRYASLLFSAPVVLLLGGPLLESAWDGLRRGRMTSDLLLMTGVLVSFVYSAVSLWNRQPHVYFEVTCAILVAVTIGRWLEAMGRYRATHALDSMQSLFPQQARVVEGETNRSVPIEEVASGVLVKIAPGERIPVDGVVVLQPGTVDEQIVTGESLPVEKLPGERVFGGSLNLHAELVIRATASAEDGAIGRILAAMQQALRERGPYQRLADQLTAWLVPVVAVTAGLAFLWHLPSRGVGDALMIFLAVILIACPCALAIATPLAGWIAANEAIRRGVFFRSGDAFATLADSRLVCLDKTGTITEGSVCFYREFHDAETPVAELYSVARRLSQQSTHPLAMALFHQLPMGTDDRFESLVVEQFPGRGILARDADGTTSYLGSRRFLLEQGLALPRQLSWESLPPTTRQNSLLWVGWNGAVHGLFEFTESIRPSALRAIATLQEMGIGCRILTGDHQERADVVAKECGIAVEAELLPEQKLKRLREWKEHVRPIVMVGDGVNDAPALAAADIGIALGAGAAVSRDAADICLWHTDLEAIPWAIQLARRCVRVMRRNLCWAFGYNLIGVALAAAGWLNPIVAAVAMIGSSLLVVVESLRLGRSFANDVAPLPSAGFNQRTDRSGHLKWMEVAP